MKIPITKLKLYPGNARRGDIDLIAESLDTLGQYKPIVVCKGDKAPDLKDVTLAGNHTLMAAQRLGWDEIDVHYVDVDEETARKITLVDNKASDESSYDVEALLALVTDLDDLTGTGFTQDEVNNILEAFNDVDDDDGPLDNNDADEPSFALIVDCDDAADHAALKAELLARGFTVGDA